MLGYVTVLVSHKLDINSPHTHPVFLVTSPSIKGRCDFATGSCGCPYGFGFDPNYGVCGAVVANTSRWVGIARCPGIIDATAVGAPVKSSKDDRSNYAPLVYVSVNPTSDLTQKGAIYTFPWLPNSPVGAAFDFQSQQLFLNLTSALSAGKAAPSFELPGVSLCSSSLYQIFRPDSAGSGLRSDHFR